jgi:hypothetical protein
VKRLLLIMLLAAGSMAVGACERLREDAEVKDHDQAVQEIQEESDRRRPAYREVVEERFPGIAEKRAEEWAEEWAEERARSSD